MLSARCRSVAKLVCKQHGLHFVMLGQGAIELMQTLEEDQREQLKTDLLAVGLELMDETEAHLIENIKSSVEQVVKHPELLASEDFPTYLSRNLNQDYTYLAHLFSEVSGATMTQYFIAVEMEWIKEMIMYGGLEIAVIAQKMKYSSAAHLSLHFKKMAGLSALHFKTLKDQRRMLSAETTSFDGLIAPNPEKTPQ